MWIQPYEYFCCLYACGVGLAAVYGVPTRGLISSLRTDSGTQWNYVSEKKEEKEKKERNQCHTRPHDQRIQVFKHTQRVFKSYVQLFKCFDSKSQKCLIIFWDYLIYYSLIILNLVLIRYICFLKQNKTMTKYSILHNWRQR